MGRQRQRLKLGSHKPRVLSDNIYKKRQVRIISQTFDDNIALHFDQGVLAPYTVETPGLRSFLQKFYKTRRFCEKAVDSGIFISLNHGLYM